MAPHDTKKGGALGGLLLPLLAVTAVGGGGGWLLGSALLAPGAGTNEASHEEASANDAAPTDSHGKAGAHDKSEKAAKAAGAPAAHKTEPAHALQVKELPPIVTNLGAGKTLVRLLTAIVFDPQELKHAETLIPALMADLNAFVNTLDLQDIEGPDGLRRLQEELNERALIRSERHVRELIIESLVVQ